MKNKKIPKGLRDILPDEVKAKRGGIGKERLNFWILWLPGRLSLRL